MRAMLLRMLAIMAFIGVLPNAALAQQPGHALVRPSLAYLVASGTPQLGSLASVTDGVQSQATGFFVSDDGFILTTEHFFKPLQEVKAVNMTIFANLGDPNGFRVPVSFVAELKELDLMLLRADFPFGVKPPPGLHIGSTANITLSDAPAFLTSGFSDHNYIPDDGQLIEARSPEIPYAWTLRLHVDAGQSGSPVYIETPTGVEVVGVVKGTVVNHDSLTQMIPIEYSMPLIGHFKIDELEMQVAELSREMVSLRALVGDIPAEKPPIGKRIGDIELDVGQIGRKFNWRAETLDDGSLRITYEKLVGGKYQIDRIDLILSAKMLVISGPNADSVATPTPPLKLNSNKNQFERTQLQDDGLKGTFIIPNVQDKLRGFLAAADNVAAGTKPYSSLDLIIKPIIGETILDEVKISVTPSYVFTDAS